MVTTTVSGAVDLGSIPGGCIPLLLALTGDPVQPLRRVGGRFNSCWGLHNNSAHSITASTPVCGTGNLGSIPSEHSLRILSASGAWCTPTSRKRGIHYGSQVRSLSEAPRYSTSATGAGAHPSFEPWGSFTLAGSTPVCGVLSFSSLFS